MLTLFQNLNEIGVLFNGVLPEYSGYLWLASTNHVLRDTSERYVLIKQNSRANHQTAAVQKFY